MTELLKIKNLHASFHSDQGETPVLHGVELIVPPQETVALVGESGSGKSVTAFAVLRLLAARNFSTRGEIFFNGQDLLQLREAELRGIRGKEISMIFQEPMTSLNPVYPIGSQLVEPLLLHRGLTRHEAEKEAVALLDRTRIKEPARRLQTFPHQLSGGQRQRVMIAMALACRPHLLIADEPTTALDVTIQAQILELLAELQDEFKMAILLITHDLNMVRHAAKQVAIMRAGRLVESGPCQEIFSAAKEPYTRELLAAIPHGEQQPRSGGQDLLTVEELSCAFAITKGFFKRQVGEVVAVNKASLTLRAGTTYGIVGESGSGKSTLAYAILRLVESKGELFFNGEDIRAKGGRELQKLRRQMQMVFQDPFSSLSPRLTAGEIIGEGLKVHERGISRAERRQLVAQAMEEVGLEPQMAGRFPHEFSGGQRQRIAIARALVLKPRLIIMDEPTSALDMPIQAQIIELLREIQQRHGISYIFISHDLRVIRALADQVAVMEEGRIVEQGETPEIFHKPSHPYTKKLLAAAFRAEEKDQVHRNGAKLTAKSRSD
ncbi:MAG: ABC transporter ATP-binding protein [Thermodesulfobacteriota bacterium]